MNDELKIRSVMSKEKLHATGTDQAVYALVEIKPGAAAAAGTMPANFGLVLDRSGSMDGEKMNSLKEAVGYVADRLGGRDIVSVTIFDDQVETIVPGRPAGNRGEIMSRLDPVIARGGTQISDGLKAGLAEVKKAKSPERVNRVLLLTDGQTWDDEDACLRLADEAGKEGVAVTTIGIGEEWNEKLLLQISERSRGNSHYIRNPIEMLDVFRQEVEGLQSVAAVNLKLTARLSPGVKPMKIYATVPMISDLSGRSISGTSLTAGLGSLDGNRGQRVLIELHVPAEQAGAFTIGEIEVAYDIPSRGVAGQKVRTPLSVEITTDAAAAGRVNAEVMNLVEKISAFKLQTRALTEAEAGNIAAATKKLQSAATVFLNMGEDELAEAVEKEITALQRTGSMTAAGTKKLEYGTRKLTQVLR